MDTLARWIFEDLLRIPAYHISGNLFQDLLYLILIPSIVLLFFLHYAAANFVPEGKKKWRTLVAIAFYLLIVQQGWYGPFAAFAANYMILFLVVAFLGFFVTRFIGYRGGREIGSAIGSVVDRSRKVGELEEEKRYYEAKLAEARAMYDQAVATGAQQAAQEWAKTIRMYEKRLREIEKELRKKKRIV